MDTRNTQFWQHENISHQSVDETCDLCYGPARNVIGSSETAAWPRRLQKYKSVILG